MLYMLSLSFYTTFRYILLVCLLVLLHETYMIVHFIHVVDIACISDISCVGSLALLA